MKRLLLYSLMFVACLTLPLQAEEWGHLTGRFIWDGELPKVEPIKVTKEQATCGKELPNESLQVDSKTKGIANVVIYLRSIEIEKDQFKIHPDFQKLAKKRVTMRIEKCRFVPYVLVYHLDRPFFFKNKDPIVHNPNPQAFGEIGMSSLLPAGKVYPHLLSRPQRMPFPIPDNISPWMKGYLLPLDHPYFAVTKTDGSFEIKHLPVGEWEFQVWHETTNYLLAKKEWEKGRFKVTIKNEETTDIGTVKVSSELFKEKE